MFLATVITLAGVTLLGVACLEVSLPFMVYVKDLPVGLWDPSTGPRTAPNQSGRWIEDPDVNAPFHVNLQGWNYPRDFEVTRPQGTRRVCIVGDSQVESLQVKPEEAMYSVAERIMSRPDRPVQWYPFGNSGFGTSQEYEVIRHHVLDYQPDLVVLLYVQNDPFDCSPYIVNVEPQIPVYYLGEAGELRYSPPAAWDPSWRGRLAIKSALFRYFITQKHVLERIHGGEKIRGVGGLPLREESEFTGDTRIPGLGGLSKAQRQERTWLLTEKLLQAMRDECRARGSDFAIAFRGWQAEIDAPLKGSAAPPMIPREQDPYCLDKRVGEMGREQVQPIAARLGVPYLDLTTALREAVARSGKSHCFQIDQHYNSMAHEAAGKALAEWVEGLLDPKKGAIKGRGTNAR